MGPPVNGGSGFRQSPTSQYGSHMPSPISQLSSLTGQTATPIDVSQQSYGPQYIGPGDASLFDFNLSEMNFGNHYGALEFGMLGHMSSGAQENEMSSTQNSSLTSPGFATQSYMDTGLDQSEYLPLKTDDQPSAWRSNPNEQSVSFRGFDAGMDGRLSDTRPAAPAFAIGSGNSHFPGASPASSAPEMLTSHDGTLRDSAAGSNPRQAVLHRSSSAPDTFIQQQGSPRGEIRANLLHQQHQQRQQGHQDKQKQRRVTTRQANPSENISKQLQSMVNTPAKRRRDTLRRDPSAIYSSVTQPYPYTQAFHAFSMVLKRRFHKKNVIKIAKALALIRPSFISLNHTLLDTDLIFMEKCFQRGLWDYEDYSNAYGTPTIVCRRTGEVAHVSKEFSLLTGWTKEVLLGEQPNLNVNYPSNGRQPTSGTATASSSRGGFNTPRGQAESTVKPEDGEENQQPTSQPQSSARQQQPVFLAELMDEDSVVRFYEDYSTLAFADSKGSAWSPCNVLQYKTQQMSETAAEANATSAGSDSEAKTNGRRSGTDVKSNQDPVIRPAERMWRLGSSDGKVHCMYCWMVKRDVFNIPMMIVVNVSLRIHSFPFLNPQTSATYACEVWNCRWLALMFVSICLPWLRHALTYSTMKQFLPILKDRIP